MSQQQTTTALGWPWATTTTRSEDGAVTLATWSPWTYLSLPGEQNSTDGAFLIKSAETAYQSLSWSSWGFIGLKNIFNHFPFFFFSYRVSTSPDSTTCVYLLINYIIVYLCFVCICLLYYIFNVSSPSDIMWSWRPALQKAQIPNNIQTQIVSFFVLSQKQSSLRKYYFRILIGNWDYSSNSPFLQLMKRMSTAPPTKGQRDLLDHVIRFLVIWCIDSD
jgi:hypothetical protein